MPLRPVWDIAAAAVQGCGSEGEQRTFVWVAKAGVRSSEALRARGHGAVEVGIPPVRRGQRLSRSDHAAAQSRLAAHRARRCEQQAGCVGAPGRSRAENVRRSRLARKCPRPGLGERADHTASRNATRRAVTRSV